VSDTPSADSGDRGSSFQAAKDAVASAAEQVRANAPGAYDASAKAARYVRGFHLEGGEHIDIVRR
jgi:hypothetical protein